MNNLNNVQGSLDRLISIIVSHRKFFSDDDVEALEREYEFIINELDTIQSESQKTQWKEIAVDILSLAVRIISKSFFEE